MAISRSLLLYGCLSLIALVVSIAETIKYAHQLHVAYAQLTALDADVHDVLTSTDATSSSSSSPQPASVNVTLPHSPFESLSSVLSSIPYLLTLSPSTLSPRHLLTFLLRSKVTELLTLNLLIALLSLLVAHVQSRTFGPLSDNEKKACRENLFNFLVFRSVFIAAVVPLDVRELVLWCAFFAVIAALRLLCIIARERFSTVTILPSATADTFVRLLLLIAGILVVDLLVAAVVWWLVRAEAGLSVVCLMLFENVVVLLGCLKVSGKYVIHLLSMRRDAAWEERTSYLYYCEFTFECVTQLLTMLHYLHVWSLYGLSVTIIDLFLFLHLRSSFVVLVDRISKYHHYRRASVEINSRYADATPAELQQADDFCAICREPMDSAKKLPCGHLFHRSCITQWMEYKGICPSCRAPLLHNTTARETAAAQQRQEQQRQRLASMYPAQAAAHLAQQAAPSPPPPPPTHPPPSPPVNDDHLEATMALIRQLQAQDAAQFGGGLGFGMLSLGTGGGGGGGAAAGGRRGRMAAAAREGVVGGEGEEKSAQERAGGPEGRGMGQVRGMIGRSLFHFNSRSIASWLPSFSFEVVRSVADDALPAVPPPHPPSPPPPPSPAEEGKEDLPPSPPLSPPTDAALPPPTSTSSAVIDEEKASSATSTSVSVPNAAGGMVRATSDRSRRDVILEATQRRLQQSSSTTLAPSSSSTPSPASSSCSSSSSSSSPPSASSAPTLPPSPSALSPPPPPTLHDAALAEEEEEEEGDAVYDDINFGSNGDESEWSDEDAIVDRITAALESKEREVEAHGSPAGGHASDRERSR